MRLAVGNIAWTAEHDEAIVSQLLDCGAEALEVAPARIFADPSTATVEQALHIASRYRSAGLPISSMQALLFGRPELRLFGSVAETDALVAHLGRLIRLAGALGCRPLVFGSPKNRARGPLTMREATEQAIPTFRKLGDLCVETGTLFCLEANATGYGCDFMTVVEEAAQMVRETAHPGVAMVLDTGNMLMAGEPPEAVLAVLPYVAHVHLGAPQLGPIMDHVAYLTRVVEQLKTGGYEGVVTIEMRAIDSAEPLRPVLDAVRFVRRLLGGS
jgi:D-psicose/D-tagatose/L-ribulose 3-epimerase